MHSIPLVFSADLHDEPEARVCGLDGWLDGGDGISKVSFDFLNTLWVLYEKMYIYLNMQ